MTYNTLAHSKTYSYRLSLPLVQEFRNRNCRIPHTPARLFGSIAAVTWKSGSARTSLTDRADRCGMNRRTAERPLRLLQELELVSVESVIHRGMFTISPKTLDKWFPKNKWLSLRSDCDGLTFYAHLVREWILFRSHHDTDEICESLSLSRNTVRDAVKKLQEVGKLPDIERHFAEKEEIINLMHRRQTELYGFPIKVERFKMDQAIRNVVDHLQFGYGCNEHDAVTHSLELINWVFDNHRKIKNSTFLEEFVFDWNRLGSCEVINNLQMWKLNGFPRPTRRKSTRHINTQHRTKGCDYDVPI